MTKREPIAIIGMGCRYPGEANTPEEFWDLIIGKIDALGPVPEDRWNNDGLFAPEWRRAGKISVNRGGFIKDVDKFDAGFFGISPLEAQRMDPQQRMMLEVSYETIEDAGLSMNDLNGSRTSVFIGISAHDYGDLQNSYQERVNIGAHTNVGSAMCIAANRLSYSYNLTGPSFALDTACSSSLNAIHMACRSIWDGDADMAFAGGVNSILKPEPQMGFSKGGFLSKDGTCYSFDERGNGYIRSEGGGLIFLKKLSQAEKDGDKIYAVIHGTAVNQDGATKGISVPNPLAQQAVFKLAYKDAGVDPHDVGYVEAHGTGTFVGDPIESNSIGNVMGRDRDDYCYMGSVKSNIGHLEPASGVAGITKLCLSLYNETIAPNIHFKKGNPNIPFEELKLKVPTESVPWSANGKPRYAGVNSFGFGGSNVHIVLGDHKTAERPANDKAGLQVATLSGTNADALQQLAGKYIGFLHNKENKNSFSDICAFSATRRSHHGHRLAVIAESKEELAKYLQLFLDGESVTEIAEGRVNEKKDKVVFIFSGQGPQWWGMGRQLFENEPLFRTWIEKLDGMLAKHADWSLIEELTKDEETSRISQTHIAQPSIFAVQIALFEMWKAMGVHPKAVVGHSIGEVAAGYVSGALTLEQAVLLIFHRSRVQFKATDKGRMLAVGISHEEAKKLIAGKEDKVSVGAVNGPEMVALSGDIDVIEAIAEDLNERDIFHRILAVNVPFHSHHMEPLKEELLASLGEFKTKPSTIPFYSTVAGGIVKGEDLDPMYWFRNVREPVLFTDAISAQIEDGFDTFIELGPHPIHAIGVEGLLVDKKVKGLVIHSLRRKDNEKKIFLSSVAKLHTWGVAIDWKNFYGNDNGWVDLPRYPWQKESYWIESVEGKKTRLGGIEFGHPHLNKKTSSARENNNIVWDVILDKRTYPYLEDHKVQGPIVFPGAGHVDLVIGAAKASFGDKFEFIEDLNFDNALFLPDSGEPPLIQMDISHDSGDYFIYSKARKKDAPWTMCSNGKINHIGDTFKSIPVDFEAIKKRITIPVPVKPMHDELLESGLYLGPSFRAIKNLWRSDGNWESLSEIEVHESIRSEFHQFNIHPGVLDSCFQTVFGIFNEREDVNKKMGVYVPRHIDRIKWYNDVNSFKLFVHGRLREWTDEKAVGELWIFNEDGSLVAEFHGFHSQYLKGSRGEQGGEQDKWFYEYNWNMKSRADQELTRNPGDYLSTPTAIAPGVLETINEVKNRPEQNEYYNNYEPKQYDLTMGYICRSLKDMGMAFEIGAKADVEELIGKMAVIEEHHRLFHHMFKLLHDAGIVSGADGHFEVIKAPNFRDVTLWMDELNGQFPQFHHESTLLGRCGPEIQGVLQGTVDPIELIFPEDKWDAIVQYYIEGFAFKKYNDIASKSIAELIKNVPEDQTIRILEIGAGTGGMSQAILPMLPADRTEYVFTDLSHMFMLKAQQRFDKYPFVQYKILDIEQNPAEQGFDLNTFDIIIASDVIHATRNLSVSLGNAQKLLASEGVLMLLEVTNSPVYLDFIFGMTEGWWLFEDLDIRTEHATMAPEKWKSVLENNGYSDVACYSDYPKNDISCQTVIMARAEKLDLEAIKSDDDAKLAKGNWLVFADNNGVSDKVIDQLSALNKTCTTVKIGDGFKETAAGKFTVDALSQDDTSKVLDFANKQENFEGIIYAWGLDLLDDAKLSAESIEQGESQGTITMLNIMKKLNDTSFKKNPSIWVLLSGSQTVAGSPELLNLSQEGLRGVSRCIVNEFPNYITSLVDFSCPVQDKEIEVFIDELFANDHIDELAFRGRKRYVNKLERISPDNIQQRAMKSVPAEGSAYSATISEYGVLDNIVLRETERKVPEANEVEVTVKASALNFRDIMIAMGLLSDAAVEGGLFGKTFGLECAGIVSAVGSDVKNLKVGDEVMATAPSCLGGFAYPLGAHCVKKPKNINWNEAASLPVVYTTAYFSLVYHCRLQKDETILIHAAAGGVGIAAIHIANAIGAEVYATVSTQEKRDYIIGLGVKPENIMNSRTLSFADEIMEKTNGVGVDVVLNSLSGEAIFKSVRCLSAYGRFVEIGKTDIYRNSKLGLQPFGNNLSYFGVDVDRLFKQKAEFGGNLFQDSIDYFVEHGFKPHPVTVFPIAKLADAFQFMGGARHIGKVIVSMEDKVNVLPQEEIKFDANGTYMITGGASGLGLGVANWMTTRGCKNLVLLSRSGTKTEEEAAIVQSMLDKGVKVMLAKGSVDNQNDMDRIFKEIKDTMPPLKGIQHAAMVLDDGSIPEMTQERYMRVFNPKAVGCWILHEATKNMDLDHFLSYSSISAIYGNPGQVSYVGANSFLDNFSHWRRAQGLPATTINWGVIGDVGFVARIGKVGGNVDELLYKQGWKSFSLVQATSILEGILLSNPIQRVATDSDWEMIGDFFPHSAESSRFAHLVNENQLGGGSSAGSGDGALKANILEAKPEKQNELLLSHLNDTFARVLGTTADKLDVSEPVTKYGLDSLMANQIRNWVQSNVGIDYSMMKIMRGPSMEEMTEQILDEILGGAAIDGIEGEVKSELDKWIIRIKKVENPRLRLFCLPYFAGGASIFNTWHELLPDDIEVCAIQLPGREERGDEKPFDDVFELASKLTEVMEPLLTTPCAFYAHSSGAGVALELARYLRKNLDVHPTRFMVGGWRAPHLESPFEFLNAINEDEVYKEKNIPNIKGHLRSLEIPDSIIDNDAVFNEMLPALRADILLGKKYKYYDEEPLNCPLTAFAGKDDSVFSEDQIKEWRQHTSNKFKFEVIQGSHLFCRDNKEELLKYVTEELSDLISN
ncbi:MAG: SDR family NAD(P)-dependent oxidoreductase [Salinivirgaceae bacterium]|jgi:acyl transferase domain-containing protein/NADPH:quinone reductase-like Zn-dependent oxidoreductase/surfactin synthase thioesterase subunit/NAD(P)-dependent dehydrogenase (short-subunit alcohol dehydrogenase family)/SAM-dependent methyltransferase/aryl carrier-like protein|nr:SDR family NAD(P)-dependent oxidoreductase [Salinivirgaceae bacterium]